MICLRLLAVLAVCAGACTACTAGGGASPHAVWPPEAPRQPQRLAVAYPGETDPQEWWKLNILAQLPEGIYHRPDYADLARVVVEQTNLTRLQHGLDPVEELAGLNRAAQAHAFDQATRDYWSHTNPEGLSSRKRTLAATGRTVSSGGENSSIGLTGRESAESIVYGWLNHEGHRELLLNPDVKFIGAGAFQYAGGEPLHFTQLLVDFEE